MNKKKNHVILTTKNCGEFAVSADSHQGELVELAEQWVAKLNAKHAGTDLEVVSFRAATDEEVKDFKHLTSVTIMPNEQDTPGE